MACLPRCSFICCQPPACLPSCPPPLSAFPQVESFLEELLLLCQRSEEYTQYLLARMGEVAAPAPLPPARETALRGGAFNSAVRELLSYYISLEEYYMEESTAKVGVRGR